ncbi:MAG: polysaccharide ABC transporter ATP-binding protein [Cyclobacteriaceae bacterium]
MTDSVIKVESLSKSFIISHESKERYTSLRDSVTNTAKRFFFRGSKKSTYPASNEEFWALKDISFEIKKGDRVGIIGRNGAGKSTLLKILSRITDPTKGRVEIDGRVASLLEVGTGFHPELTGRENVFLNGAILGMTRAEIRQKFDEIVAFAEVEQFLDTPVKRYSSGMYVRLAFAVSAHLEQEILIVDEVLAVGDAQFQKKCLGKMEDISMNSGRTVLFVSHQMDAIESLTQKCIYLKQGEVVSYGPTSNEVNNYLNDHKSNIDINKYQNRSGSGRARIVKLELWQEERRVKMIKQGEKFEILVGVQNDSKDVLDMSFVFENHREKAVFCSHLSDSNNTLIGKGYMERKILVTVPNIRKGDYLASFALFRPDKTEFYDVVLHFPLISIDGIISDGSTYFPQDDRWGDLYFPLTWI